MSHFENKVVIKTILDFSQIATGLTGSFATGLKLDSNLIKSNVFIFNSTGISIIEAAAAIAADIDVVATDGYIVIANSQNNNAVTAYYADNLNNNGNETALVVLSGINIDTLTADRYTLIRTRFFEVFYKKKGVLNDKQNQKNLYTRI